MSLFRKNEEIIMELIKLEKERIAKHEKVIKLYPKDNEVVTQNRRLQKEALETEERLNKCLNMLEYIVRALRNKVPQQYEKPLETAYSEFQKHKLLRSNLNFAEIAITNMYNNIKASMSAAHA